MLRLVFWITFLLLSLPGLGMLSWGESPSLQGRVHKQQAFFPADFPVTGDVVIFNSRSRKYHRPGCGAATQCVKNCIVLPRDEAHRRKGTPCRLCGG